jgi:hypothetical protein
MDHDLYCPIVPQYLQIRGTATSPLPSLFHHLYVAHSTYFSKMAHHDYSQLSVPSPQDVEVRFSPFIFEKFDHNISGFVQCYYYIKNASPGYVNNRASFPRPPRTPPPPRPAPRSNPARTNFPRLPPPPPPPSPSPLGFFDTDVPREFVQYYEYNIETTRTNSSVSFPRLPPPPPPPSPLGFSSRQKIRPHDQKPVHNFLQRATHYETVKTRTETVSFIFCYVFEWTFLTMNGYPVHLCSVSY